MYEITVINKIPLKPNSPRESLIDKIKNRSELIPKTLINIIAFDFDVIFFKSSMFIFKVLISMSTKTGLSPN